VVSAPRKRDAQLALAPGFRQVQRAEVGRAGPLWRHDRRGSAVELGAPEGTLEGLIEQVVPPLHAAARNDAQRGLRKHPVPWPRLGGMRVLAGERVRQLDAGPAVGAVAQPDRARRGKLGAHFAGNRSRQHQRAVLVALALADDHRVAREVDVLHAQAQRFHDAHACAVEQSRQQSMLAI
jgi:hypothetical protein